MSWNLSKAQTLVGWCHQTFMTSKFQPFKKANQKKHPPFQTSNSWGEKLSCRATGFSCWGRRQSRKSGGRVDPGGFARTTENAGKMLEDGDKTLLLWSGFERFKLFFFFGGLDFGASALVMAVKGWRSFTCFLLRFGDVFDDMNLYKLWLWMVKMNWEKN